MPRRARHLFAAAVCVTLALVSAIVAFQRTIAQDTAETLTAAQPPNEAIIKVAAALPEVVTPSAEQTLILIRATLLSLNDALGTGNYTVLRDLAAPSFREANTAGRLHQIFSDLAGQGIDLSAVAILAPQLPQAPFIDQDKRLRISGIFPGQPVQINFDLRFEAVAGRWRLFSLSVNPVRPPTAATSPPAGVAPAAEKSSPQNTKARQQKQQP
jgi:hypothetical protein